MHLPEHDCCPDCGGALRQFGEDVSEQLERIPATFKVIRHVRPTFACNHCERVVEAPAPSRPIERGLAGPALLAHVLSRSMGTTCRSIARRRSTRAKASIWTAPHWLDG
jgi:transposase